MECSSDPVAHDTDQTARDPGKKVRALWKRRQILIEAIDFGRLAAEVNRIRLRDTNTQLADPVASQRIKRLAKRLNKLQWPLKALPTDLKADASRMRRTLLALHMGIGRNHSFCFRMAVIGQRMGVSAATAERGVRDLRECHLVDVTARVGDRQEDGSRRRRDRVGGRGPSEYRILWSNILAEASANGAQSELFPEDGDGSVTGGSGRPGELPGRNLSESESPHCAGTLPHSEGAPPHGEGTLPHGEGACNRHARAISPSMSFSMSPSPALPQEEEAIWKDLQDRLQAYGLGRSRVALKEARKAGWSPQQVDELLRTCEAKTIVDTDGQRHYAWKPGVVYTQLTSFDPGTPIGLPPGSAYTEAVRAREQRARISIDRGIQQRLEASRSDTAQARYDALDQLGPPAVKALCESLVGVTRSRALKAMESGSDPRTDPVLRAALAALARAAVPSPLDHGVDPCGST